MDNLRVAINAFYDKHGKELILFAADQLKPIREYPYPIAQYFHGVGPEKYLKHIVDTCDPKTVTFNEIYACVSFRLEFEACKEYLDNEGTDFKDKTYDLTGFHDKKYEEFTDNQYLARQHIDFMWLTLQLLLDSGKFNDPETKAEIESMLKMFGHKK